MSLFKHKKIFITIILSLLIPLNANAATMIICKHSGEKYDWMFIPDGKETSAYVLEGNKENYMGEIKHTKTSVGWIFEIINTHQGQKETMTWDINLKKQIGHFKMNLVGKKKERKVKCSDKY